MSSYDTEVELRDVSPNAWVMWLVLGIVSVALGVWLLFSPRAAIGTLAILLAFALFVNGIGELVFAGDRRQPWLGYVLGAMFLIAGIVVILRPGKSLWFLAIVVGISVIVTGLMQLGLAIVDRDVIRHWMLLAVLGAIGIVVGLLAIAWPEITVMVLALLIGVRLVVFGIIQIMIAFSVRSLTQGAH